MQTGSYDPNLIRDAIRGAQAYENQTQERGPVSMAARRRLGAVRLGLNRVNELVASQIAPERPNPSTQAATVDMGRLSVTEMAAQPAVQPQSAPYDNQYAYPTSGVNTKPQYAPQPPEEYAYVQPEPAQPASVSGQEQAHEAYINAVTEPTTMPAEAHMETADEIDLAAAHNDQVSRIVHYRGEVLKAFNNQVQQQVYETHGTADQSDFRLAA